MKRKPVETDETADGTLNTVAAGVVVRAALGTVNGADGMEPIAGGTEVVVPLENKGIGTEKSPWLGVVDTAKGGVDIVTGGTVAGAKEKALPPPLAPNEKTLPPLEPKENAVVADEGCTDENNDVDAAVLPEATAAAAEVETTGMNEVAVENGWLVKGGNPAAPVVVS